ncbi:lipopolysaccharide biosynthesis protein [Piscinibacter sakaiensis]|uniref:lipopolysaccharide biosynthesis protein n=1 Tax=Piscinibacter sakaiensis TaxID=1547922 RepID=UPI0018D00C4A|nr:oligosaccharide flippase family protein [Piscinibacter sakaiensis]
MATLLVSVPLTLNYLGPERYGLWMALSSLAALLAFADLGIGNGVLTLVAKAHGEGDIAALRRVISSAGVALCGIAALLLLALALLHPWVPWARLFNVRSAQAVAEAGPAFAVFGASLALAIPLTVVQRVQLGLQRGFLANLWQIGGNLLGLAGVLLAIRLEAGLPWLVAGFTGLPLLAALANTLWFFGRVRPDLAPRPAALSRPVLSVLARTGFLFFVLQAVAALTYASDPMVIAQLLGAGAVAPFAVTERLFGVITMLLGLALTPLWPAYGEALARGDADWVRRTLRRSLLLAGGGAAVLSLGLVVFGPWILRTWTGSELGVGRGLLIAFAVWKVLEAIGLALAMFLNAAHLVRFQVGVALVTATAAIAGKLLLTPLLGPAGVLWASAGAFAVCCLLPFAWRLRRLPVLAGPAGPAA